MKFSQYCERRLVMEMSDGDALERAIVANPMEGTPWGVYGDWLDENGDQERAKLARQVMALLGGDARAVDKCLRIIGRTPNSRPFVRNFTFWQQMDQRFTFWPEWWLGTSVDFRRPLGLQYYYEVFLPGEGDGEHPVYTTVVIDPGGTEWPDAMLRAADLRCTEDLPEAFRRRIEVELADNLDLAGWTPGNRVCHSMPAAGATAK